MRRLGGLFALFFASVTSLLIYLLWSQHAPGYSGRSLDDWIQVYQTLEDAEFPAQAQEARRAIFTIGTNSLPQLVHWLSYDPLLRRRRVVAMTRALPGPIRRSGLVKPFMLDRDEFRADTATRTLRILGPSADPVLLQLTALARQTNSVLVSRRALSVLAKMEKEGLVPLQAVVADVAHPNRMFALDYLRDLGTNALPAVPSLVKLLLDSSPAIRMRATNTLASIAPQILGLKR